MGFFSFGLAQPKTPCGDRYSKADRGPMRLKHWLLMGLLPLALSIAMADANPPGIGADISSVFARAKRGEPLRYVALGGSITQAGAGWIGPWLRQQFPQSDITSINSGMAGTGSALGIFRVERDVISHQPDLVAIEYCVNDGYLNDEDAIRYMESLIVRLKQLPKPPAILIIEAADKNTVNLQRHRKVAQHYGLLEVDLQKSVNEALAAKGRGWDDFFSDAVHPNATGHAFYARVIEQALEPLLAASPGAVPPLPQPISSKPLLLDGTMSALAFRVDDEGWHYEPSPPQAARFFRGVLTSELPGVHLPVSFRGTCVGLLYAMNKDQGVFFASLNGGLPKVIKTNSRDGYASTILSSDLSPGEHRLDVVLPVASEPRMRYNGPVRLGYLLLAGTAPQAETTKPDDGPFHPEILASLKFIPVPASDWGWTGPFRAETGAFDARSMISASFPPESAEPGEIEWREIPSQDDLWVDLGKLLGTEPPATVFAKTQLEVAKEGKVLLSLSVDYFAKVWVNGRLAETIAGPHGDVILIPATLRAGTNDILLKLGSGSSGFGFSLAWSRLAE
ncbi:GDSL-type esterase/lipase family protein [Terrimicrobium sacchariphilum]|nr:GDSL-type esterase/lipase family protein [Terrimicrobium sacchariphilum]